MVRLASAPFVTSSRNPGMRTSATAPGQIRKIQDQGDVDGKIMCEDNPSLLNTSDTHTAIGQPDLLDIALGAEKRLPPSSMIEMMKPQTMRPTQTLRHQIVGRQIQYCE